MRINKYLFLVLILFIFFTSFIFQENRDKITLRPVKQFFNVKEYYIKDLVDERGYKGPAASILHFNSATKRFSVIDIDLESGTFNSIKNFIANSLPINTKRRPIIINLRTIKITEDKTIDLRIYGHIELVLDFYLEKSNGDITKLLTYSGASKYQRSNSQKTVIETALQQTFSNSIKYLNTYFKQEGPGNFALAKSVILNFSEYSKRDEDTIYYSVNRPLKLDDFKKTQSSRRYAAYIFPGFGYDERSFLRDGVVHTNISLRVFVAKSSAWVDPSNKNAYVLNHEQRHFDIEKIMSEKFKNDLRAETLTVDNYQGIINVQYLQTLREINEMQKRYDDETRHGLNKNQQESWNILIDQQLHQYGIK